MVAWRIFQTWAACCVAICAATARAETLTPRFMEYQAEVKDDAVAGSCNVMLTVTNIPQPEVLNFRFLVTYAKAHRLVFVGFSLDVADLVFSNGRPAGMNKVRITNASFSSPTFNSAGRLNGGAVADGGLILTTNDRETQNAFQQAFIAGQFVIEFSREGVSSSRGYRISEKPPGDVLQRLSACVVNLK